MTAELGDDPRIRARTRFTRNRSRPDGKGGTEAFQRLRDKRDTRTRAVLTALNRRICEPVTPIGIGDEYVAFNSRDTADSSQ